MIDPNNIPAKRLYYHDSADDLRREMLRVWERTEHLCEQLRHAKPGTPDSFRLLDNLTLNNYAYNLAALLGWIGREFGDDAKWRAALVMDDSLMNGDGDGLNDDLIPSPAVEAS